MKGLSILFVLQGLSFFIQSLVNILEDKNGKFINLNFNPQLYIIGIFIGILFIFAGIGIGLRKKYAFYLSVSLCSLMSLYVLVGVVFLINQNSIGPLVLIAINLLIYLAIARYILKRKLYFNKH
ncbi:hypothetical protein [Fusibacter bizertensis]